MLILCIWFYIYSTNNQQVKMKIWKVKIKKIRDTHQKIGTHTISRLLLMAYRLFARKWPNFWATHIVK
ncbi:hypothetical protein TW84_20700 [Vibrio neptunius]|nr:hypothetical protein TW84_20700 [Vibrio neptunius]